MEKRNIASKVASPPQLYVHGYTQAFDDFKKKIKKVYEVMFFDK